METTLSISSRSLQYYVIAKKWSSDLEFFRLETAFLQKLLDRYIGRLQEETHFRQLVQARGWGLLVPHGRRIAVGHRGVGSDGQRRYRQLYLCRRGGRGDAGKPGAGHHPPGRHALHGDRYLGLSGARGQAGQPHRVFRYQVQDLLRQVQADAAGAAAAGPTKAKIGDR